MARQFLHRAGGLKFIEAKNSASLASKTNGAWQSRQVSSRSWKVTFCVMVRSFWLVSLRLRLTNGLSLAEDILPVAPERLAVDLGGTFGRRDDLVVVLGDGMKMKALGVLLRYVVFGRHHLAEAPLNARSFLGHLRSNERNMPIRKFGA